jgi:hypothetical protein
MTDINTNNLRQGRCVKRSVKFEFEERRAQKSYNKWGGIDGYREKFLENVIIIKILERLIGRGPTLVNDVINILVTSKTTRDAKIY